MVNAQMIGLSMHAVASTHAHAGHVRLTKKAASDQSEKTMQDRTSDISEVIYHLISTFNSVDSRM